MKTVLAITLWAEQQRLGIVWTMTSRRKRYNNISHRRKTPMLGSANSDFFFQPGDTELITTCIPQAEATELKMSESGEKKKEKKHFAKNKTKQKKQRKYKPPHCNVSCMSRRDCRMPDSSGGPELNSMPLVRRG